MPDLIQIARDTAANWATADPVLEAGEMGFETDTKILRIGDGTTKFTDLAALRNVTNLSVTTESGKVTVVSDTGQDADVPAATTSKAGVMTAADKTKLDGIASGATDDLTGPEIEALLDTELGNTGWKTDVQKAAASDIRAGTADKYITADGVESAAEEVTLTDAATIAVDWSTFINGNVTLGGNRTLGNPSNGEPGTSRLIRVIQDGTGSRTLAFEAQYKHPGGTAPTLSTAAGAVDVLEIYCVSATEFYVFSALGMA